MAKEKDDVMEMTGVVKTAAGNGFFFVSVDDTEEDKPEVIVKCRLSGKIQKHNIKIIEGSQVKIHVSVYDPSVGRIVFRIS